VEDIFIIFLFGGYCYSVSLWKIFLLCLYLKGSNVEVFRSGIYGLAVKTGSIALLKVYFYLFCFPFLVCPKNYVFWGQIFSADLSQITNGTHCPSFFIFTQVLE